MNHTESDDTLRMLDDAASAFARPDAQRTRTARDQHRGCDPAVWRDIASMGWLAATLLEAQGGLGLGLRAGAAIAQRLGYAGYHEPFVGVGVMAVECLAACGADAAPQLAAVIGGNQLAGLAWQPADGRLEPDATEVVCAQDGDRMILSGVCRFVAVARADIFIVAAKRGNELTLYRVPRSAAGLVLRQEAAADGSVLGHLTLYVDPEGTDPGRAALRIEGVC
jgi:alkylation response protein AidB-like acyl-CoA dehydrogenase